MINTERFRSQDAFQAAIGAIIGAIYVIILGATPWIQASYAMIVGATWLILFYLGIKQLGVKYPFEHILGTMIVCILINLTFYLLFGLVTWEQLTSNFFGSPVFIVATFLSFPVAIVFDIYNLSNIFMRYGWWSR